MTPALECLEKFEAGEELTPSDAASLLRAEGPEEEALFAAADRLRKELVGDKVSYVVNANLNFTNVCYTDCKFCGFWRRPADEGAYTHPFSVLEEKLEKARSWDVTEICMQGGLNSNLSLDYYAKILELIHKKIPGVHIHAYSPAEIDHLQRKTRLPLEEVILTLKEAGLGSVPGTAAEILCDEVKDIISPRRIRAGRWEEIIRCAHGLGLPSTSTIMIGHIETPEQVGRHLEVLRSIQKDTGGFTEFVPLPFVPYDNVLGRELGITEMVDNRYVFRVHAVSRLYFGAHIPNNQVSWPKIGLEASRRALQCGVNDLGGTLIEENISRSSGSRFGQYLTVEQVRGAIEAEGRIPLERSTLYQHIG
ncbi:MAG: 5-amino-6-(D-ribitylamino)uracil--L-tyrosine 4-hydroxyphenyl transferase CofH [Nitrospinota bacterium]